MGPGHATEPQPPALKSAWWGMVVALHAEWRRRRTWRRRLTYPAWALAWIGLTTLILTIETADRVRRR